MLTIDEAIQHAESVARIEEDMCRQIPMSDGDHERHRQCAENHIQLAGWLRELKRYREAEERDR